MKSDHYYGFHGRETFDFGEGSELQSWHCVTFWYHQRCHRCAELCFWFKGERVGTQNSWFLTTVKRMLLKNTDGETCDILKVTGEPWVGRQITFPAVHLFLPFVELADCRGAAWRLEAFDVYSDLGQQRASRMEV